MPSDPIHLTSVLSYTACLDDQHVANSFKLDHAANQTQNYSGTIYLTDSSVFHFTTDTPNLPLAASYSSLEGAWDHSLGSDQHTSIPCIP